MRDRERTIESLQSPLLRKTYEKKLFKQNMWNYWAIYIQILIYQRRRRGNPLLLCVFYMYPTKVSFCVVPNFSHGNMIGMLLILHLSLLFDTLLVKSSPMCAIPHCQSVWLHFIKTERLQANLWIPNFISTFVFTISLKFNSLKNGIRFNAMNIFRRAILMVCLGMGCNYTKYRWCQLWECN